MRSSYLILILSTLCGLAFSAPIVLPPGVSGKFSSPPLPPSKLVALGRADIDAPHAVVKIRDGAPAEYQSDSYSGTDWKREDMTRDNSHIGGKRSDVDLDIVNRDSGPIEFAS